MSKQQTTYIAKPIDENGHVAYSAEDDAVWQALISRQMKIIQGRACDEYIQGLAILDLPEDRVPQCTEISDKLLKLTGWVLEPVAALISFDRFFELLAERRFPAATFMRTMQDLNYLKEPDLFHEVFGHCPLLTNPAYADFTHTYGKLALQATHAERVLLAQLYWFTVEFGLIQSVAGLRAYGGGILSSINETVYSLESNTPKRKPFMLNEVLQTTYRIDVMQPLYFVLNDFDTLFHLTEIDLMGEIRKYL